MSTVTGSFTVIADGVATVRSFSAMPYAEFWKRQRDVLRVLNNSSEWGLDQILGLPRDTPLVFHCHHGGRSQQAAEYFLDQGFTRVANLRGGIEAWQRRTAAASSTATSSPTTCSSTPTA